MVAAKKESKFVSCFADSTPQVDITFRDVLLQRATDHYKVGVDNFSLTNTSLSMIEPMANIALIRIVRNPSNGNHGREFTHVNAPNNADTLATALHDNGKALDTLYETKAVTQFDLSIKSTDTILSVQQLMHRLEMLAADVNMFMGQGLTHNRQYENGGYEPAAEEKTNSYDHLTFEVATNGMFKIKGTNAFWNCFSVEVPAVRNQFGLYGTPATDDMLYYNRTRQFLSVHPDTGAKTYKKLIVHRIRRPEPVRFHAYENGVLVYTETPAEFQTRVEAVANHNRYLVSGATPRVIVGSTTLNDATVVNKHDGANAKLTRTVELDGCIFSSLERRVALELGCSLPVKNSPMIDHNRESPDFVLGRWIWRTDPRIECNDKGGSRRYYGAMPACTEYQGAQDRVTYHELQAQSKIQTLRLKLFARLRTFDEETERWGMRVIALPTTPTDWWHARLHFVSN
mgnify:CR=1 FL=1